MACKAFSELKVLSHFGTTHNTCIISKRFWVSSGILGCLVKLNESIFQLQHKKGNLLIDNIPDIVPDSDSLFSKTVAF